MVNISKFGDSAIKFKFTDNDHYLFNGEIEVPINSLLLVLDESDMVTFKKIDGDPFVSFLISDSNFESKETLIYFYKTSMVGSTGGGSESGITSGDVQTMIDTSLEDYYDIDEIDAALSGKADSSAVTESINAAVSGKADTSAVTEAINSAVSGKADSSAVTESINAAVSGKADTSAVTEEISAAVSGKADSTAVTQEISAAISGKADSSSVYTKTEVDTALGGKQDTLIAGDNITISGNVISADGGGVTVDSAFSRTSENPVQNKVISNNATNGDGAVTNTGGIYKWQFSSVGGVYTNKGFYLDTINGETVVKQYPNTRSLQLVETSAITSSVTSASTDSQVPSAKAVYDALQEGGGGGVSESAFTVYSAATDARLSEDEEVTAAALNALNDRVDAIDITVDDALDATSENPVQNKVIYAVIGDIESLLSNI